MSDVGGPTPMKREQDPEAEIRRRWSDYASFAGAGATAVHDIAWLLSELARLRTEAHQMRTQALADAKAGIERAAEKHPAIMNPDYVRHIALNVEMWAEHEAGLRAAE